MHFEVLCSKVLKLEQIANELAGTFGNHDAVRLRNALQELNCGSLSEIKYYDFNDSGFRSRVSVYLVSIPFLTPRQGEIRQVPAATENPTAP
jgi:hypothetical protein